MHGHTERPRAADSRTLHPDAALAARQAMISERLLTDLADTFSVLADPSRVRILLALATTTLCVLNLASVVGVSESAISQHLRVLRSLRWVKRRRQGRSVYYSLHDRHVHSLPELELEHISGG